MKSTKTEDYKNMLEQITDNYELPTELTEKSIDEFLSKTGSLQAIWGLCWKDVSKLDFSEIDDETFVRIAFNEYTKFPDNFKVDYKRILGESKNPGLFISKLHEQGINGNGINVAVIDKPIFETHQEFNGRMRKYILINPDGKFSERNEQMHFHGITCAGFLCGNTCGVAKSTNLYYYAYPEGWHNDEMHWGYYFKGLDMIKEHNEKANAEDKIKIVSVSNGFGNQPELRAKMNKYVNELKDMDCYVIYSNLFGETFTASSKVFNANPDGFDAYKLDTWQDNDWHKKNILVPAGGRTSPCNSGNDKYMYNGNGSGFSWAIPYLCGVFALALQVNRDLSYDDFCEIAKRTAFVNNRGLFILNPTQIICEVIRIA